MLYSIQYVSDSVMYTVQYVSDSVMYTLHYVSDSVMYSIQYVSDSVMSLIALFQDGKPCGSESSEDQCQSQPSQSHQSVKSGKTTF